MKTQATDIAVRGERTAAKPAAKSVRRIIDDLEVMASGDRRDGGVDQGGINRQVARSDIYKHRRAVLPENHAGGGDITEGSGDYFPAYFEGFQRELQGSGAIVDEPKIGTGKIFSQPLLQFTHQRTVVGQPMGGPDLLQ